MKGARATDVRSVIRSVSNARRCSASDNEFLDAGVVDVAIAPRLNTIAMLVLPSVMIIPGDTGDAGVVCYVNDVFASRSFFSLSLSLSHDATYTCLSDSLSLHA